MAVGHGGDSMKEQKVIPPHTAEPEVTSPPCHGTWDRIPPVPPKPWPKLPVSDSPTQDPLANRMKV
jgi:hypothetical protein